MTFNDERLARAVAACPVPVVTGIGHEPDTSICDMVADRRCSTPTAAAESVAPALDEIVQVIAGRRQRLGAAMSQLLLREGAQVDALGTAAGRAMERRVDAERVRVDALARHRCLQDPAWMLTDRDVQLRQSEQRLHDAMPRLLGRWQDGVAREGARLDGAARRLLRPYEAVLARTAASLEALSPLKVLARGYAIVQDEGTGHVLTRASEAEAGQPIRVRLGEGELRATVVEALDGSADGSAGAGPGRAG